VAHISTLVDDIQMVLRTNVAAAPLEQDAWAHVALRMVASIAPRPPTPGYVRDPYVIWPREIGEQCLRKIWYNLHPETHPAPVNAVDSLKFKYGHLIEEVTLTYAELAGHEVQHRQMKLVESMESTSGDRWLVRGKIDAVIDGVLVDVKSCSRSVFQDLSSYYEQVRWYAKAGGWKEAGILAVEKSSGRMRYEAVPLCHGGTGRIQTFHGDTLDELSATTPPDRSLIFHPGSNGKMPDGCLWCPHKYRCWPDLVAYKYAYGPEFFVEPPMRMRVPRMTQAEVENEPIRG
jgi:hypothetical protein